MRQITTDGDEFNKWSYDHPDDKRSSLSLRKEKEGGFLLPTTELDYDGKRDSTSVRGIDSSIAASRRFRDGVRCFSIPGGVQDLTEDRSASQSKRKGKGKPMSGDDPGHDYDDIEENIDAADVTLARSLQEEEDLQAAVALQLHDSDDDGEGSNRRGIRNRNASDEIPSPVSANSKDERPTPDLEAEKEIEIELEMGEAVAKGGVDGDSCPSDFWELMRHAKDDGEDDDEEYNGFVDDDGGVHGTSQVYFSEGIPRWFGVMVVVLYPYKTYLYSVNVPCVNHHPGEG